MSQEISVAEYGKQLFRAMTGKDPAGHWETIREKAEPLVRELIRLNTELPESYDITGQYINGKKVLSKRARIEKVQKTLWRVPIGECKEDDLVWLIDNYDYEMTISDDNPVRVEGRYKETMLVEHPHDRDSIIQVGIEEEVIRAPDDWNERQDVYCSDKFWLENI